MLELSEDDQSNCALGDLEYQHLAIYTLQNLGSPF